MKTKMRTRIRALIIMCSMLLVFMVCGIINMNNIETVYAEEPTVISYKDITSKDSLYSLANAGLYDYKKVDGVVLSNPAVNTWSIVQDGYVNKTFKFSFKIIKDASMWLRFSFGATSWNGSDGYIFDIEDWEKPFIVFGRGSFSRDTNNSNYIYTNSEQSWKDAGLSPVDGNRYDVEITFLQVGTNESAQYKIYYDGTLLTDKTMSYDSTILNADRNKIGVANNSANGEYIVGDKSWFEGELETAEIIADISKIAEVGQDSVSENIHIPSCYTSNQLYAFKFTSTDKSQVVLRLNNNTTNYALNISCYCAVINSTTIKMGSDFSTVGTTHQNTAITSWYNANETYTVNFGMLEYKQNGISTHNDIVLRIYNSSDELVFNQRQVLDPNYSANYNGLYIDGTNGTFTVSAVKYFREYTVVFNEYGNVTSTSSVLYLDTYTFLAAQDVASIGTFKNWYFLDENSEKVTVELEGTWSWLLNDVGTGEYAGKYIVNLIAEYDYYYNNIEYHLTNATNNSNNPTIVYSVDEPIQLLDPVGETGYYFYGWYDTADYSGDKITQINYQEGVETVNLYAKSDFGFTVYVVYPTETKNYFVAANDNTFELNADLINGYNCIKWQKLNNGVYEDIVGTELIIESEVTLKPIYEIITYTITYNLDGATNSLVNPTSYTIDSNTIILESPTKDGYFFTGWYNENVQINEIVTGSYGNLVLEANFVKNILPNSLTYYTGEKFTVPVVVGLPDNASYHILVKDSMGNSVSTESEITLDTKGDYTIEYNINTGVEIYTYTINLSIIVEEVAGCRVSGMSISLSDDIIINYSIVLSEEYSAPYLVCTFIDKSYTLTEYTENNGKYIFNFTKISAQYLTSNIKVEVYATDIENVQKKVAEKNNYCVRDYCTALLIKNSTQLGLDATKYEKMQTLVVDLLNYGAAAQKYLNVNIDDLANNNLTEELKAKATSFVIPDNKYSLSDETGKDITIKAARLVFDSKIGVQFAISIPSSLNDSNYTAIITINSVEYRITSSAFEQDEINGEVVYIVYFNQIAASCFDSEVYFKIVNSENMVVSGVLTYSVNSFIARNSEEILYQIVYSYGMSAAAYKN